MSADHLTIRPEPIEYDCELELSTQIEQDGEPGGTVVVDDLEYQEFDSTIERGLAQVQITPAELSFRAEFHSSDESVATVDESGLVRSVEPGEVDIYCTIGPVRTAMQVAATVEQQPGGNVLLGYVEGSLGRHIIDAVAARLSGTPDYEMFVGPTPTQRNPSVWTGDWDLTGVSASVVNPAGANRPCTLISPRHIVASRHSRSAVGSSVVFLTNDNAPVLRSITAWAVSSELDEVGTSVGLLNADVPPSITHYKIMPAGWVDWLTIHDAAKLPTVHVTRTRQMRIRWRVRGDNNVAGHANAAMHTLADSNSYTLITGDSSWPFWHPINGQLVLLNVNSASNGSRDLAGYRSLIDAAMAALGGGYQTEVVDLSAFHFYG